MYLPLSHDPYNQKFEIHLDNTIAFLRYEVEDRTLTITRTEIPETFRGTGVAGRLFQAAIDFTRVLGWKINM